MTDDRPEKRNLLAVLIAGFALLIILLAGSAYVAVVAMQSVETETADLVAEEQATVKLIDEVQGEEGSLSAVFYSLAIGHSAGDRAALKARLDTLEQSVHRTTEAGMASRRSPLWREVGEAADAFIKEGRVAIDTGKQPSAAFYKYHQNLIDKVAALASADFLTGSAEERTETEKAAQLFRFSVALLGVAFIVAVTAAVLTVVQVKRMVDRLRWQAAELAELSSRNMAEQEESARKFSRELHDQFGQTLTAIEANLVAMQNKQQYNQGRMDDCLGLLKDAMQNVREVSQLLRPAILDDFGLSAALQWLADGTAERTGIMIDSKIGFEGRIEGEQETQLFRITQEALTNVARHSKATHVDLILEQHDDHLVLTVSDNGRGFTSDEHPGRLGLVGMRARARTAGGTLHVQSQSGKGVRIEVTIPLRLRAAV